MIGFESVSTWAQPEPPPASTARTELVRKIAEHIVGLSPGRLRVAVDGFTAAGKTSFGHELAGAVRSLGRPTARASFDDFKKPWRDAQERGYDRTTGAGYYRNAYDFVSARDLLLIPAGPGGTGRVALCAHDPLTGVDHRDVTVELPTDAVLIVDSVFAFRPEYDDLWDYRIWLDVDPEASLARGVARDTDAEGGVEEATRLHRDRYHAAELLYLAEVDPRAVADMVIDNRDFAAPRIARPGLLPAIDVVRRESTVDGPGSARRLLGVFAHPDDEVFCAGGTMAHVAKAGGQVVVLSATRGERGEIRDAAAATRRTLGAVRESELRAACAELGVASNVRVLDFGDGTLPHHRSAVAAAIAECCARSARTRSSPSVRTAGTATPITW